MNYYEDIIFQEMDDLIKNDLIKIENDNKIYFERLKINFPVKFSKIAWEKVENRLERFNNGTEDVFEGINNFIDSFVEKNQFKLSDNIIYIGDNIDIAIRMPLDLLKKNIQVLFSIPQHSYVTVDNAFWCFNYTFEKELYFGYANSVIPK